MNSGLSSHEPSSCKWPICRLQNAIFYPKILLIPQAAQTHVAREECNVIYTTYVTRQATVENIRDFVWEIYY